MPGQKDRVFGTIDADKVYLANAVAALIQRNKGQVLEEALTLWLEQPAIVQMIKDHRLCDRLPSKLESVGA